MTESSKISEQDNVEFKSKTQIKQEMAELKQLGQTLIDLPSGFYNTLPIPEELNEAILVSKRISSFPAKKRQLQYIARVIRKIDMTEIEIALKEWQEGRKGLGRQFKALETLRERLLADDPLVLNELINAYPHCDIQKLRQLVRSTKKEQALNKPPANFRKLFTFLKELEEKR